LIRKFNPEIPDLKVEVEFYWKLNCKIKEYTTIIIPPLISLFIEISGGVFVYISQ
jgi:hypothetical protein